MKKIVQIAILLIVLWGIFSLFSKDEYKGFYYPDRTNLSEYIESNYIFETLDECRDWVDSQIYKYNPNDRNYDYECGLNCKYDSSYGVEICKETLQ